MDNKMVKFFWEHPVKFVAGLFLAVVALCLLLTFMPEWFRNMFGILLLGAFITMMVKIDIKERRAQQSGESPAMNDYEK